MTAARMHWLAQTVTLRLFFVVAILSAGASGCTTLEGVQNYLAYNDMTNDFVLGWRNSAWARQAWELRKDGFAGQPYLDHFGAGFRAGYIGVASGGNGCTPALPPREYWSWKYQTAEGQGKTAAWFSGYPHGAKAAEEDGAGNWGQIQVSETLRAEYRLGHEPPYMNHVHLYDAAHCCPPGIPPGEVVPLDQPHEFAPPASPVPDGVQPTVPLPELGIPPLTHEGASLNRPARVQEVVNTPVIPVQYAANVNPIVRLPAP